MMIQMVVKLKIFQKLFIIMHIYNLITKRITLYKLFFIKYLNIVSKIIVINIIKYYYLYKSIFIIIINICNEYTFLFSFFNSITYPKCFF
jgi:hypothetical protein